MKFKNYAKLYFISCGGVSIFLVLLDLIFNIFKDRLAPSLMECYIFILIFLYITVSLEFIAKKNKKLHFTIINVLIFIGLVIGDIIRDILKNRDVDILGAIITSAFATALGIIARIVIAFYEKSRYKYMNQKLKEYQDKHEE
jgi:hypothetical protein